MKKKFTVPSSIKRFGASVALALLTGGVSAQTFTGSFTSTSSPAYTMNLLINNLTLTKTCASGPSPTSYTYTIGFSYHVTFSNYGSPYFPSISSLSGTFNCGGAGFNNLSSYSSPWTTAVNGTGTTWTGTYICASAPGCCAPGPITDAGCTGLNVAIQGNGFARSSDPLTYNPAPVNPLPVKLVTFDGSIQNKEIFLSWVTATETNNKSFTIERSSNSREWDALKTIEGAGSSTISHSYQYVDSKPLTGTNFYRLKQTDNNGDFTYSYILAMKQFSLANDVTIYPNPARDNKMNITGLEDIEEWNVSVTNATSQQLYNAQLKNASVTLPELTAGMYFIRLSNVVTNESKVFKYIKQ